MKSTSAPPPATPLLFSFPVFSSTKSEARPHMPHHEARGFDGEIWINF